MSDENHTQPFGESSGKAGEDPLGIIGWEIGGKYKIRSYIGGGGFGEVYDAYNINLVEQRLVVKFFKRVQTRDRFDREAKILCMLDHPNISRVVDYLPDEGALVIQYIDGKDGGQLLRESGSLPTGTFLKLARAMIDAIAYAHERKIAHRDIKPGNVIIDKNGHVYLIDFGIAKEIGGTATKTGYQALTPMFAAPERQAGDKAYNPFLSDIYEMGITLFNFATNSMPYRNPVAPNFDEWGGSHAKTLSPPLRGILKKATHPDPDRRYQTAAEMAADLGRLTEVYAKRSKRPLAIGVVIVALAAAGFLGRDFIAGLFRPGISGSPAVSARYADTAVAQDTAGGETEEESRAPGVAADTLLRDSLDRTGGAALAQVGDSAASAVEETPQPPERDEPEKVIQTAVEPDTTPVAEVAEKPSPELRIQIDPADIAELLVDGRAREPGKSYSADVGPHLVRVIHPEYPILSKTIRVTDELASITLDLKQEFARTDTVKLQLALYPPTDEHLLELTLNGRTRRYTNFPVLDLECLSGEWQISADIQPVNTYDGDTVKADSCVTFPYGKGPRNKITGSRGSIALSAGEYDNAVPLLIYWSE